MSPVTASNAASERPPWSEDGLGTPRARKVDPSPDRSPSADTAAAPASPGTASRRSGRWAAVGLTAVVVAAAVGYFVASWWRFQGFYGTNWDLGIGMQSLWSTSHGYLLYEAGDFETSGLKSFLSLHSTYVAIPLAYVYALAPGPDFLFALQAGAVAVSAVPLYLIGRRAGLPGGWLVPALAVYLVTFTVASAVLYDFHWESLLPAEFAWTYYLWSERRYLAALVPATLGVLTLEVFPFLLVGLVLAFAYEPFRRFVAEPGASLRAVASRFRAYLRRAAPLLGLLLFAIASYVALRVLQHDLIPGVVGTSSSSLGAQVSLGIRQLFGITATSATILPSLTYWFLVFAAFGFLPLLARQRALLLSVPWFYASVFVDPRYSSAFGNQYAFVALACVSIAFVEALAAVHRGASSTEATAVRPLEWLVAALPFLVLAVFFSTDLLRPTPTGEDLLLIAAAVLVAVLLLVAMSRDRPAGWSRAVWRRSYSFRLPEEHVAYHEASRFETRVASAARPARIRGLTGARARSGSVVAAVLLVVVVANLAMSPFSPVNFNATVYPGYRFSFDSNPAYAYMDDVLSALPPNAIVLASDNLFPFVANDVNAYSLLPGSPHGLPYLPFSASHLPPYVLLSTSEWTPVPTWLKNVAFNGSVYGIRAMVYAPAYPDTVYLLETGYAGPAQVYQAVPFPTTQMLCPSAFALGASGRLVAASGTACGSEIESDPASNLSGNGHSVWFGPYVSLLPGRYNVTMSLRGGVATDKSARAAIVLLNGGYYGDTGPWYSFNLNATTLSTSAWTLVSVTIDVPVPVSGAEFRGYIEYSGGNTAADVNGFVDLNYVELAYSPAAS